MNINFDNLKEQDLLKINTIMNNSLVAEYFNFEAPLSIQQTEKWFEEVKSKIKEGIGECIILRDSEDQIVGWNYFFENYTIDENIKKIINKYDHKRWSYIAAIVVNPKFSGQGYGKILLEKAEEIIKNHNINFVWLGTNSDNKISRKLYDGNNYKILGTIKNLKKRKTGNWVDQYIYGKML